MLMRREVKNVGVRHGCWGEDVAAAYLERKGYEIVDRNVRPCPWDQRFELDIVARDVELDTIVFVEVKQTAKMPEYGSRLHRITRNKKRVLRIAANAYRRRMKRECAYRFDVIEVYGVPERGVPSVDHIEGEQLFVDRSRYVRWN